MSVVIEIPQFLQHLIEGRTVVSVTGSTVGDCLEKLMTEYPRLRSLLLDKEGRLLKHVDVYLNGKSTYPKELASPVRNGDRLSIVLVVAGG